MKNAFNDALHNALYKALTACLVLVTGGVSLAAEKVDYLTQIKPLLQSKCYSCHGALKQEADLRLDTRALMLEGQVVVPGDAGDSLLIERISTGDDERMPPPEDGAELKPNEIALISKWIEQGAIAPDEPTPTGADKHWAFVRIKKPAMPDLGDANPVDYLLQAKRRELSLKPQPQADRSILLRRLYLDLTGLPPTRKQLQDPRDYEVIVDQLLQSPQHGERWARHWMDVWRYSDWYGLGAQVRYSQKHIWRWRDWIVESLNRDKGYDRMIQEMLAADELAPGDQDAVRATGFLARNYYLFNRTTWLDSTVEHTGKAFLGLTLNCAKCHDHKYDPLSHIDYYQFRAIFEPHQIRIDPVPGETDLDVDGLPVAFDNHLATRTFLHKRGDPKNPDKKTVIRPAVPAIFASFAEPAKPVALPAAAYAPSTRPSVQQTWLTAAQTKVEAAQQKLTSAKAAEKEAADRKRLAAKEKQKNNQLDAETDADKQPFEVRDDFDKLDESLWQLSGAGWKFAGGELHQTESNTGLQTLRLRKPLPRDFDLTCEYTTTGGGTYKSVTFRFDESADARYCNFVYTSAHGSGKVQVAYKRDGKSQYPPAGIKQRPIETGKKYKLRFAVRNLLVNVWLDDEMVKAFNLPGRQSDGRLTLAGYDATVAYDSILVKRLAADVKLTPASNQSAVTETAQNPQRAVAQAKAELTAARARLAALTAGFAADNAKYKQQLTGDRLKPFITAAARKQAQAAIADAELQLLQKPTKALRNRIAAEQQRLQEIDSGKATYESVRTSRKALESPAHKQTDYAPVYPSTSSGRRLALAKWMTSRDNPLTARVAVNQVWMRHFGQPLVGSVFDFGLRARQPVQAKLLDLLAVEFMESGWSFRKLHRLIVTSDAYRLSSSTLHADPKTIELDPTNQYYWRMNSRRMESQVVRDSLLHLAGELNLQQGGPPVDPNKGKRRSLYFKHSRDHQNKFLSMFDDADLLQCYRRTESIVPQQALALANSALSFDAAAKIAAKLTVAHPDATQDEFIHLAFSTLLARQANVEEAAGCKAFCESMRKQFQADDAKIRSRLVHALLNHNDFVSIR